MNLFYLIRMFWGKIRLQLSPIYYPLYRGLHPLRTQYQKSSKTRKYQHESVFFRLFVRYNSFYSYEKKKMNRPRAEYHFRPRSRPTRSKMKFYFRIILDDVLRAEKKSNEEEKKRKIDVETRFLVRHLIRVMTLRDIELRIFRERTNL